MMNSR